MNEKADTKTATSGGNKIKPVSLIGLISLLVGLVLGGFITVSMPKVMASSNTIAKCKVNFSARDTVYDLNTGYYKVEGAGKIWIAGGLAKNPEFDGLVKKMNWNCTIPQFMEPLLMQISEGVIVTDEAGESHVVYVAFAGTDHKVLEEAVEPTEMPNP